MSVQPTEACRFPVLTAQGRAHLRAMMEHPCAPVFRDASGHRLREHEIPEVAAFHARELATPACTQVHPPWLDPFLRRVRGLVPFYKLWPDLPLRELPTTSRADLARDVAAFVPDDLPVDRLLRFDTTGTTGHRIAIPSHPTVAARHLAFLRKALAWHGIELRAGRGQVGVVLAGFQERCFTYASVNPLFDETGLLKLNLHPSDWNDPDDRRRYLDAMAPELVTGDPISLPELASLGMTHVPRAALSTSMALHRGLREDLRRRLGCPVLDIYSLNESGPVAARHPEDDEFRLLQGNLLVEILDEQGRAAPPGERGEIVLTGGYNDWLPLVRYRTGDHARRHPERPDILLDLEGRAPVRFLHADGHWINNIEFSQALAAFPIPRFALRQRRDGSLWLSLPPRVDARAIAGEVARVSGRPVEVASLETDDKVVAYGSELDFQDPRVSAWAAGTGSVDHREW